MSKMQALSPQWQPVCLICGSQVSLEQAKTDEGGRAVHECCYLLKIKLQESSSQFHVDSVRSNSVVLQRWDSFPQARCYSRQDLFLPGMEERNSQ